MTFISAISHTLPTLVNCTASVPQHWLGCVLSVYGANIFHLWLNAYGHPTSWGKSELSSPDLRWALRVSHSMDTVSSRHSLWTFMRIKTEETTTASRKQNVIPFILLSNKSTRFFSHRHDIFAFCTILPTQTHTHTFCSSLCTLFFYAQRQGGPLSDVKICSPCRANAAAELKQTQRCSEFPMTVRKLLYNGGSLKLRLTSSTCPPHTLHGACYNNMFNINVVIVVGEKKNISFLRYVAVWECSGRQKGVWVGVRESAGSIYYKMGEKGEAFDRPVAG